MATKKKPTYNEAVAELEDILQKMQSDKLDIDLLASMTKRAKELINICREKLLAAANSLNETDEA